MRIPALRPLALALLLGAVACQDDAAKLAEHMSRGEAYAEEERFPEAIIEYKSALQLAPNDADVHYKLSHVFLRARKIKEGFWELRETVRLDPSNHDAKLEFSQLAILGGEFDEALRQVESVVAADPTNIKAHLMRGQALDALKRHDEALAAYQKGVEVGPEDESALRVLARAQAVRGNLEEAEALWLRVLETSPRFASYSAYAGFLRAYFRAERIDDAEAALMKGLELAEESEKADAYAQLASFYYGASRPAKAISTLKQSIESVEDPLNLIYMLARLQIAEGNEAEADALIERATTTRPDDPRVFLVLSSYRSRKGDRAGALAAVDRALALDADSSAARLRKAEILVEMGYRGEYEGGVEEGSSIVAAVLQGEPSHPEALFTDAKIRLTKNQIPEAVASARAALDSRPDWAEAHYVLGMALAGQKEYTAARSELARARELDAALLEVNQVLAQVHSRLGEDEYAVEAGRRYLRERPGDKKVRLLVAQSLVRLGRLDDAKIELQSVAPDERDGEVLFALGRVHFGLRDHETAQDYLELANAEMPNQPDILDTLLQIDVVDREFDESVARIRAAVEAEPENARLRQLEGQVAELQARIDDAEASYLKAVELSPDEFSGYQRLARFYARTGRLDQTVDTYEKALQARPEDAHVHHYLGMLYELRGDHDRAVERYEDAIRFAPDLAEAKNNLAYIYADSGKNLDRALDLAQDAKTLLPDNPSVADTLGWVLYRRGVPAAAISYLKEAEAATAENDRSLGVVRHHLALAYEAAGDTEQALAAVERSIAAVESQSQAIEQAGGEPGPEPDWVPDARALRERLQLARTSSS